MNKFTDDQNDPYIQNEFRERLSSIPYASPRDMARQMIDVFPRGMLYEDSMCTADNPLGETRSSSYSVLRAPYPRVIESNDQYRKDVYNRAIFVVGLISTVRIPLKVVLSISGSEHRDTGHNEWHSIDYYLNSERK